MSGAGAREHAGKDGKKFWFCEAIIYNYIMTYDLIIIGGGPAGVAAGVYAARKRLKTLFLTYDWGGQSIVSPDIQNWIGTTSISGEDLAKNLREHLEANTGESLEIRTGAKVSKLDHVNPVKTSSTGQAFCVTTDKGESFETKTVLIATGSARRKLMVPGAAEFEQKGITYCASCDGPLFAGQDVAVVGGGNAGFETAAQLSAYCKSVTLLHHGDSFKADAITVEKLRQHPNVTLLTNAETQEVKGDPSMKAGQANFVKSLIYKDAKSGESKTLSVTGIFVEIGALPATEFAKGVVELSPINAIKVDPRTQRASVTGIWAAGDCTDGLYHQNNIAAGDAVKALEDIYNYLHLES